MKTIRQQVFVIVLACLAFASPAFGQADPVPKDEQQGYWRNWFERSDRSKGNQPHWVTPLVTTTPRLEQEFRYDVLWQQTQPGTPYVENFGNGKGLELIPSEKIEIIAGVPPYILHHNATVQDGFGDVRVLVKYRLLAADEARGNYIVTAWVDVSLPTGSGVNGQTNVVVTPTLAYGKGFGRFDVQGTVGAGLPSANEPQIGRIYAWNNAFQYHIAGWFWPEVEVNASFFQDGKNAGKRQAFLMPGLILGRIPLNSRLGLTLGTGVQIAVTKFHTSAHNVVLSVRLPF